MEPGRSHEAVQNCFLPMGARHKVIQAAGNEIYLYDEAEALMYVCSETSMPPQSAGNVRAPRSAETQSGTSPSRTSHSKSEKSYTIVYESGERQTTPKQLRTPKSAEGAGPSVVDFKSQIRSKFKEFAITPNSSFTDLEERPDSVARVTSAGPKATSGNHSQDIEEIFIRDDKFLTSSAESERLRVPSEDLQDDVYSTGMSDMEEGARSAHRKQKSEARAPERSTERETTSLPPWYATKSTVKPIEARKELPTPRESPTRIGPPVQGRLSVRSIKNAPPCFCLLDEIRKNNLVMREDIFSSSSLQPGTKTQNDGRSNNNTGNSKDTLAQRQKSTDAGRANKPKQCAATGVVAGSNTSGIAASATAKGVDKITTSDEVYEVGVDGRTAARQKGVISSTLTPVTNSLAVNIRYVKNQFDHFWRPFSTPVQEKDSEGSDEELTTRSVTTAQKPFLSGRKEKSVIQMPEEPKPQVASNHNQVSDDITAKSSTPSRWPEKYVKLPGLLEAFVQKDSNFKDIRISDGMSFESVNAVKEMDMKNMEKQMKLQATKDVETLTEKIPNSIGARVQNQMVQTKMETRDAATDIIIPMMSTRTQTVELGSVDHGVQCESRIIDEATGRNIIKRDHKEILICDDSGEGVQLYNELGHPLTDMDGYLLKDSHGRFLVRLDEFGVPVSCTNGQAIFMDDSSQWAAVKTNLSIVHQARKRPIKKGEVVKKSGKARCSMQQLETAMRNLEDTLMHTESLNSNDDILKFLTNYDAAERSPRRSVSPSNINTTNSLIAEMKSIARLRNALLEKVNFIAGGGKKARKPGTSTKLVRKKSPGGPSETAKTSGIWEGQDRPFSPTHQAIKKLKEEEDLSNEMRTEADLWMTFDLNEDHPPTERTYGNRDGLGGWVPDGFNLGELPKRTKSGMSHGTDSWMNLPDSRLNANFPSLRGLGGIEGKSTDLWSFNDKPIDKIRTPEAENSNVNLITQTEGFRELDKYLEELSGMKLAPETEGSQDMSSNPVKPAFPQSHLLALLEKQYNVREGSGLDEVLTDPRIEGPPRHAIEKGPRGGRRPSVDFNSSDNRIF